MKGIITIILCVALLFGIYYFDSWNWSNVCSILGLVCCGITLLRISDAE